MSCVLLKGDHSFTIHEITIMLAIKISQGIPLRHLDPWPIQVKTMMKHARAPTIKGEMGLHKGGMGQYDWHPGDLLVIGT